MYFTLEIKKLKILKTLKKKYFMKKKKQKTRVAGATPMALGWVRPPSNSKIRWLKSPPKALSHTLLA
jgi:hypothetical protein